MDVITTIALGAMVLVVLLQSAAGVVCLLFGETANDRRRGVRHLGMAGLLVLLLVLLAGLPACGPIAPDSAVSTVEGAAAQSMPVPSWAAYPVGQWLNMDWDLWSCPRGEGR